MPQTVMIIGAARGIGYAATEAFLARGARIAFCSPHSRRVADAETRLHARLRAGDARSLRHDRCSSQQRGGRAWSGDFVDQDLSAIDAQIDVNLKGMMYATQALPPTMLSFGRGVRVYAVCPGGVAADMLRE